MTRVRAATAEDLPFLERMLAAAADWRPDSVPRAVGHVLADPTLAHYIVGWPLEDDFGCVAEDPDGAPVGAAWCRFFDPSDPGYGFVDPDVPEMAIGVVPAARGRGVGGLLLAQLAQEAGRRGIGRISLSVEADNPAVQLYERAGYVVVAGDGGSLTMVLDVEPAVVRDAG